MRPGSTVLLCLLVALCGCPEGGAPWVGPAARAAALCPADMVLVPGGAFLAGGTPEEVGIPPFVPDVPRDPRAPQQRTAAPFCMDRGEWQAGGASQAWVTWQQARVACRAQGRRLCTEDEWSKACGGPLGWMRPYGAVHVAGLCHADVEQEGSYDAVLASGDLPGCASVYGALDLEGNLSEWAEGRLAPPDPDAVMQQDPGSDETDFRMILGGTMWPGVYGSGCQARHGHPPVAPVAGDDGFRCCRDTL